MNRKFVLALTVCALSAWPQRVTDRKSADIRGGGGDGKCTIEVVVDDLAEVEIIGSNASIRTLNGSPASFRRFECNQQMPTRPNDFRFKGIDGRGRQDLVRSASDGGRAIIRIEDSKGGSEGYTFDIFWRGGTDRGWRGGFNDRDGGWDNNDLNFDSGRNGGGSYRERNGRTVRLDGASVFVSRNGDVNVSFEGERRVEFSGRVVRRQGRRIIADVRGRGMSGTMEIETSNRNSVNRITLSSVDLNWSN